MELAERIEKRMNQYGFHTIDEMVEAINQQEPLDIGIFVMPIGKTGQYEKNSKTA